MLIHHVDAITSLDLLPTQDARLKRHEPDVKPMDTTKGNFLFAALFSSPKKWPCPAFPLFFLIGESFLSPGLNNIGFSLTHGLQEDGLRLALLLRLSPVLPIPFDSYWCGVSNFRFGWMKLLCEIHPENHHYLHEYFSHVQIFMNMNLWTMALGTEFVNMWIFCCPFHLFLQEMGATFEHGSMTLNMWMFVELG